MPNSNDFLMFATASGANVLPPATWATTPVRSTGFQSGLGKSIEVSTAIRQAAFVAAMVAQFTADLGPGNVLDNGNLSAFEAQFEAALKALVGGGGSPFSIGLQNIRQFTTVGATPYTPTAGARAFFVQAQAPGGGGGGTSSPGAGAVSAGQSGSAGGYAEKYVLTSGLTFPATITIGAAGAGGAANGNGGSGGTTSFVCTGMTSIICTGGQGGPDNGNTGSFPTTSAGSSGGTATGGDINVVGGAAQGILFLSASSVLTGLSGTTSLGSPALQTSIAVNGQSGTGFGTGGGGGLSYAGNGAKSGGAGSPSVVIITELF